MPVTDDWIPYANDSERALLAKLSEEGRSFTKLLVFDADPSVLFPSMILHDCEETAVMPMEIVNTAGPVPHGFADFRQRYFSNGFGVDSWWAWNLRTSPLHMPDFPPRRRTKPRQVEEGAAKPLQPDGSVETNPPTPSPADPYSGVFI